MVAIIIISFIVIYNSRVVLVVLVVLSIVVKENGTFFKFPSILLISSRLFILLEKAFTIYIVFSKALPKLFPFPLSCYPFPS